METIIIANKIIQKAKEKYPLGYIIKENIDTDVLTQVSKECRIFVNHTGLYMYYIRWINSEDIKEKIFRGKAFINRKWVYSKSIFYLGGECYIPKEGYSCLVDRNLDTYGSINNIHYEDSSLLRVMPETISQYTGFSEFVFQIEQKIKKYLSTT